MRSTLRKPGAFTIAALLTAAGVASGSAPASAAADDVAPLIVDTDLKDDALVIKNSGFSKKINFTVRAKDAVGIDAVGVGVFRNGELIKTPDGQEDFIFTLSFLSGTATDGTWGGFVRHDRNFPGAGEFTLRTYALDLSGNFSEKDTKLGSYDARWDTRIQNFNVGAEPAKKGEPVKVSGTLQHVSPDGWDGFAEREVTVQFRKSGQKQWEDLGTTRTDEDGKFATRKFRAKAAGTWRAVFDGNAKNVSATSDTDSVAL
ncbi:MAG: hypothetical protein ACT4P1_13195 [Sporichthyaceae bacterium]